MPLHSVCEDSSDSRVFVWVVVNSQVKKIEVKVVTPTDQAHVFISEGLKVGETVVTAGVHQLKPDEQVKLLAK